MAATRILMLLTNEFRPDPRVAREAQALSEEGYQVTVLAWDREGRAPSETKYHEVEIERVRSGKVSSVQAMVLNYPLFFVKALWKGLNSEADIIHCHDFDTLFLGILLSRLKNAPLVYDAHEHYAKMVSTDLPKEITNLLDRVEFYLVKKADLVIVAHDSIRSYLQPYVRSDLVLIANYVDLPERVPKKEKAAGQPLVLFYGGALEPMRYIEESIEAVKKMEGCVLRIAGAGRLQERVQRAANGKVIYLGFLPHDLLMKETAACDAVLSLFDIRNENYRVGTPTKLPEAMSVATPIITSEGTNAADIVNREGCGIVIEWSEGNFRDAVDQLKDHELRRRLGEAGRRAAEREYNWAVMKRRLLESYESLRAVLSP